MLKGKFLFILLQTFILKKNPKKLKLQHSESAQYRSHLKNLFRSAAQQFAMGKTNLAKLKRSTDFSTRLIFSLSIRDYSIVICGEEN